MVVEIALYEKAKDRNTNHVDVNRGQTRCVTLSSLVDALPWFFILIISVEKFDEKFKFLGFK
jgi:hypothetical protein